MTRLLVCVVPLTALGAAAAAQRLGGWVGLLVATVLGGATAGVLWLAQASRLRDAARHVNRWAGDGAVEPLELTGAAWRELATAANAVGFQLRGVRDELRTLVPWTERLVSSLDVPAYVFGPDGRLVTSNEAGAALSGFADDSAPPTTMSTLGSAAMAEAVDEARESGSLVAVTTAHAGRDLRITASPLDDHVLVVVSDQTRARHVELLRRDFVVNASHELKTPVTAIAALTEALRVAPEDRRASLVDRLDEESQRLVHLVHDLLDLRLLDDDAERDRSPVDLVELVVDSVAQRAVAAAERDVRVTTTLPAQATVVGDPRQLQLVVDNLLTNAVLYNRPGGTVDVTVRPSLGGYVLVVADTGIGIPSGDVDRIFERFYRVDVARSRERGGTGLGLSIVRNAVERHGGRVRVQSLLGTGTTFTVHLPVEPAAR